MNHYKGISANDKHRIIAALKARGAGSCPRCRDRQWTVSEYTRIEVQATMEHNTAERTTIPAIMIVWENCGFISQHALQPLGVWPQIDGDLIHTASTRAKVSTA